MKLLAICPTYNESKNVEELVSQIFTLTIPLDLLFIDDNSPDGTSKIIEKLQNENNSIYIIKRKSKLGLGTAYCTGFKWALEKKYDAVLQIDADLSHDPKDIPKLINALKNNDLIIGSRYINGVNVVNWPIRRLLLSYFANIYARFITGVKIKDLTGGYKCIKKDVLMSFNLDDIKSEGYSFQIEVNFMAYMYGFKLKEIPIVFTDRTVGESKMNKKIIFEAIFIVPKLFLKKIFNRF